MNFELTPEEQKQMEEDYAEMIAEENRRHAEEQKHNARIFNAIREALGNDYLIAVQDCLHEAEACGKLELVRNPQIEKQEEDWEEFDHVLVDQYVNGGYVGDDFAGDIYIPLRNNLYLKSYYQM